MRDLSPVACPSGMKLLTVLHHGTNPGPAMSSRRGGAAILVVSDEERNVSADVGRGIIDHLPKVQGGG